MRQCQGGRSALTNNAKEEGLALTLTHERARGKGGSQEYYRVCIYTRVCIVYADEDQRNFRALKGKGNMSVCQSVFANRQPFEKTFTHTLSNKVSVLSFFSYGYATFFLA